MEVDHAAGLPSAELDDIDDGNDESRIKTVLGLLTEASSNRRAGGDRRHAVWQRSRQHHSRAWRSHQVRNRSSSMNGKGKVYRLGGCAKQREGRKWQGRYECRSLGNCLRARCRRHRRRLSSGKAAYQSGAYQGGVAGCSCDEDEGQEEASVC